MTDINDNLFDTEAHTDPIRMLQEIAESTHREELVKTIKDYSKRLEGKQLNRKKLKLKYKLLRMLDQAHKNEELDKIEKELCDMAGYMEGASFQIQRNISIIILAYSALALFSFGLLAFTDSILLPSFNIPYSVLFMGLVGCLVSMCVKLPDIKKRDKLSLDLTVWFIISPPIAVIMAGMFYGICQILLTTLSISLSEEDWYYWILSWVVGFVNWVSVYNKFNSDWKAKLPGFGLRKTEEDVTEVAEVKDFSHNNEIVELSGKNKSPEQQVF
ncbi:MAG: hypothetical protein HKM93_06650 [Desulfobacteraceae bacterium]|nr:hypothetical protein [Desulfobacteraceae bacterium]